MILGVTKYSTNINEPTRDFVSDGRSRAWLETSAIGKSSSWAGGQMVDVVRLFIPHLSDGIAEVMACFITL